MALPIDVTDPNNANIETQAFGLGLPAQVPDFKQLPASASPTNKIEVGGSKRPDVVTQEILVGPSQSAGPTALGGASSAKLTVVDQEILVGPAQTAGANVAGATFQPGNGNVQNVTQNNVAGQVFGSGLPKSVNV